MHRLRLHKINCFIPVQIMFSPKKTAMQNGSIIAVQHYTSIAFKQCMKSQSNQPRLNQTIEKLHYF